MQAQEEIMTMGTFLLNGLEFGVELLKQREVLRMMPLTRVPCSAGFIEGVINLRGGIIPVINLRKRFGMPGKDFDRLTRILNVEVTQSLVVGFIVDCVGKVMRIERSRIEPPPAIMGTVEAEYIEGVGKCGDGLLLILDVPRLLSDREVGVLEQMA